MARQTLEKKATATLGRQAPADALLPETLLSALKSGTDADKLKALKKAGILDARSNLTKTYKSWSSKVTRTSNAPDVKG